MSEKENQNMKKKKTVWRLIAKSLGEKSGKDDREADKIALIRLSAFLSIFITNSFIVANALRHWNDNTQPIKCVIETSTFSEYQTPSLRKVNRTFEFE
jgi:hypothetical protein